MLRCSFYLVMPFSSDLLCQISFYPKHFSLLLKQQEVSIEQVCQSNAYWQLLAATSYIGGVDIWPEFDALYIIIVEFGSTKVEHDTYREKYIEPKLHYVSFPTPPAGSQRHTLTTSKRGPPIFFFFLYIFELIKEKMYKSINPGCVNTDTHTSTHTRDQARSAIYVVRENELKNFFMQIQPGCLCDTFKYCRCVYIKEG